MLKNKMSLGVVSLLSLTLVSNSVSIAMMSTAQAADGTQSAARADKSFGVIAGALKKAHKAIKTGAMQPKDAMIEMSETLLLENISLDNVDNFVAATQSPKEHEKFQVRVKDSLAAVSPDSPLSSQENAEILAAAIQGAANDGLSYDGCVNLKTAGWLIVAAGVAVGIIALLKTRGTVSWQKKYENEKRVRQERYNSDKYAIENYQTVIPRNILALNGKIDTLNEEIMDLYETLPGKTEAEAAAIMGKINAKKEIVADWTNDVNALLIRLAFLSNPANQNAELAQLALEFNTDMATINAVEAQKIADVPRQKEIAGTLGIVAGSAAALGAAFVLINQVGDCD